MLLGARRQLGLRAAVPATKLLGLALVGYSVAVSTVLFQTVTGNRILTPSIMGFDTLFIPDPDAVVFFFTSRALAAVDPRLQFVLAVAVMIGFSGLLFRWLFLAPSSPAPAGAGGHRVRCSSAAWPT